jgi:hypothetical protein
VQGFWIKYFYNQKSIKRKKIFHSKPVGLDLAVGWPVAYLS